MDALYRIGIGFCLGNMVADDQWWGAAFVLAVYAFTTTYYRLRGGDAP